MRLSVRAAVARAGVGVGTELRRSTICRVDTVVMLASRRPDVGSAAVTGEGLG